MKYGHSSNHKECDDVDVLATALRTEAVDVTIGIAIAVGHKYVNNVCLCKQLLLWWLLQAAR